MNLSCTKITHFLLTGLLLSHYTHALGFESSFTSLLPILRLNAAQTKEPSQPPENRASLTTVLKGALGGATCSALLSSAWGKSDLNFFGVIPAYAPLACCLAGVAGFTLTRQIVEPASFTRAMNDFMGAFFILFGSFKILSLRGFAQSYRQYDLLAEICPLYAHIYPFLELGLGLSYITNCDPLTTNLASLHLNIFSALGVMHQIFVHKRPINCPCLGSLMKVPISVVTLFEDLLMAGMALGMLHSLA
jgi:hypothetical protein